MFVMASALSFVDELKLLQSPLKHARINAERFAKYVLACRPS